MIRTHSVKPKGVALWGAVADEYFCQNEAAAGLFVPRQTLSLSDAIGARQVSR